MSLAIGDLRIPKSELLIMTVKEVYSVLNGILKDQSRQEDLVRMQCFWMVGPYWDSKKNGKLRHPKQLWEIPLIDKKEEKEKKLSKITILKPGEKPFQNLINRKEDGEDSGRQSSDAITE